jgi:hypothetical protein
VRLYLGIRQAPVQLLITSKKSTEWETTVRLPVP